MSGEEGRARWLEYVLVLLVLLVLLSVFAPTVDRILSTRDHGVHLARAVQIDLGRHPFVDYPGGVYGPLVFYLSYLGQVLSGWTLLGEVVLNGLGHALAYLLLYAVCRRVGGSRSVAVAALLAGVLLMPRFYKYYIVLGPAVFLFALESGCRRGFRPANLCGLALATCATGFFRLDYGAYAVAASVLVLAAVAAEAGGVRSFLRWLAGYAGFGLLFAAPFLVPLALATHPAEVLRDTLVLVGGAKEGLGKELDAERFAWTRFYFAFWGFRILPWAVIAACLFGWRRFEEGAQRSFLIGASAFAALIFIQATHRTDPQHLLQVLPPALVLVAWLAGRLELRLARVPGRIGAVAIFLVPVLLMGDRRERFDQVQLFGKWGGYRAARAELRAGEGWDRDIASWITEQAPPGDVLVLPYWPQLYYLAERGYGTPFGWLYPGVFGERFTEAAFLESLADTPVVVDETMFAFDRDPTRGLRAFAPELMHALYQERAIVYRYRSALVLTDEPRLVRQARIPGSFRPFEGQYAPAAPAAAGWFVLQTLNTLHWVSPEPLRTIRGGALMLAGTLQAEPAEDLWLLLSGESTFRVRAELRDARVGPVFHCMADTWAVPPGVYAVELAVGPPASGHSTPTGRRVEVVELP